MPRDSHDSRFCCRSESEKASREPPHIAGETRHGDGSAAGVEGSGGGPFSKFAEGHASKLLLFLQQIPTPYQADKFSDARGIPQDLPGLPLLLSPLKGPYGDFIAISEVY